MVIENLLTNASKYTHTGGKIVIKTDRRDDMIILSVTDNGVGIKLEDRDKLFKKFSRIDNELSIKAGGSGVGLYLDKLLVELHGGHIKVASQPQEGTTFAVYLPVKHAKVRLRTTS
jgi:signal transduction histidine kinase